MPTFDIVKETKPKKSFRVASVIGRFDLQSNHIKERFTGNIDLTVNWQIGVIYGHSGTGKSTITKELFSKELIKSFEYNSQSILDDMPKGKSVDDITKTFNSVGFSSPPSWLKPYAVLSNGERMRVDLARAILEKNDLIVFDEFTSVVDRTVAKIGSAAISKAIRRTDKKFVAVSCHEDIINWLEPDWVFNTNNMQFDYTRGRLRRPDIKLEIYQQKGFWKLFRKYHYLNASINNASQQYIAVYDNKPCAFCAVLHFPHPKIKNVKRVTRLVTIPDFQGIGIGNKLLEYVANLYVNNYKFRITTSTPALIYSFQKNKNWLLIHSGRKCDTARSGILAGTTSDKRLTTSWEYLNASR